METWKIFVLGFWYFLAFLLSSVLLIVSIVGDPRINPGAGDPRRAWEISWLMALSVAYIVDYYLMVGLSRGAKPSSTAASVFVAICIAVFILAFGYMSGLLYLAGVPPLVVGLGRGA